MLEWKILGGYLSAKRADGYWQIGVNLASGKWHVFNTEENKFPTLDDAKAWCEEQDRQTSQPEIPLPKPGDVWGVPGKPETRRLVRRIEDDGVWFAGITYGADRSTDWQSWVRETGAVELVGDREELAAKVKELEDRLQAAMEERDQLQSRVRELEKNNSSASLWKLECGEAKASADTWKRECEKAQAVAADAIRERDELRKKVAEGGYYALHQKVHDVELKLAKAKASRGLLLAGLREIRDNQHHTVTVASMRQFATTLIAAERNERDELRLKRGATVEEYIKRIEKLEASCDRLMAGLRKIADYWGTWKTSGDDDAAVMRLHARNLLAAEEGAAS